MTSYSVENVFSCASLNCPLDLHDIAKRAYNVIYKKNSLLIRIRNPRSTARIYKTGKIVCMGTKSESDSYTAVRRYARIIQRLGYPVKLSDFRVTNIVALSSDGHSLNLSRMAHHLGSTRCSYEPELWPGLEYRLKFDTGTLTLHAFSSGKVIIMGGKCMLDIKRSFDSWNEVLLIHYAEVDAINQ